MRVAVALLLALAACNGAAPPPPEAPAVSAAAPAPEPQDPAERMKLAIVLRDAYRARAAGRKAEADAKFRGVLDAASKRAKPTPGLTADPVTATTRGGVAAIIAKDGPVFVRADSGEPIAFEPTVTIDPKEDTRYNLPEPPFFRAKMADPRVAGIAAFGVESQAASSGPGATQWTGLFDPTTLRFIASDGPMLVRPGGKWLYLYDGEHCVWQVWDLHDVKKTGTLDTNVGYGQCSNHTFAGELNTFISPSGKWLEADATLWDLEKKKKVAQSSAHELMMSRDEKYVAYLKTSGDGESRRTTLILEELDGHKQVTSKGPPDEGSPAGLWLNGDAGFEDRLLFTTDSSALVVLGYQSYTKFSVPALKVLERGAYKAQHGAGGGKEIDEGLHGWPGAPPPPADPGLPAKVGAKVCDVDGFVLPINDCG